MCSAFRATASTASWKRFASGRSASRSFRFATRKRRRSWRRATRSTRASSAFVSPPPAREPFTCSTASTTRSSMARRCSPSPGRPTTTSWACGTSRKSICCRSSRTSPPTTSRSWAPGTHARSSTRRAAPRSPHAASRTSAVPSICRIRNSTRTSVRRRTSKGTRRRRGGRSERFGGSRARRTRKQGRCRRQSVNDSGVAWSDATGGQLLQAAGSDDPCHVHRRRRPVFSVVVLHCTGGGWRCGGEGGRCGDVVVGRGGTGCAAGVL